jgi:hypothetical protein
MLGMGALLPLLGLILVVGVGAALWLSYSAAGQIKQLRAELDETQRQLNELKAAAEIVTTPPIIPRARSGGLDDLRQQLREAHRAPDEPASGE